MAYYIPTAGSVVNEQNDNSNIKFKLPNGTSVKIDFMVLHSYIDKDIDKPFLFFDIIITGRLIYFNYERYRFKNAMTPTPEENLMITATMSELLDNGL